MWNNPILPQIVNLLLPSLLLVATLLGRLAAGYQLIRCGVQTLIYAVTLMGWLLQPVDLLQNMVKTPFGRVR